MSLRPAVFVKAVGSIVDTIVKLLLSIMFALLTCQVALRYFAGTSIVWIEEAVVLMFTWVSFLGATSALAAEEHVSVTFVQERVPQQYRWLVRLAAHGAVIGFLLALAVIGVELIGTLGHYRFATLPMPKSLLFLSVVVAAGLMLVIAIAQAFDAVTVRLPRENQNHGEASEER